MALKTVLIIPPNDPEAVQIWLIAKAMKLPIIRSNQPRGAWLDKEPRVVEKVKEGGYERVVVVEMPGPETEAELRKMGVKLVIIDHHEYTGLDRARHAASGRMLPSSLEQFMRLFRVTDAKLKELGFDPKMVKAIGVYDSGFVWALRRKGWSWSRVKQVVDYQRALMEHVRATRREEAKMDKAAEIWEEREKWGKFFIVESDTEMSVRERLSLVVALDRKKPTPLIVVEKGRGFIYVQESGAAPGLMKHFGGFTFGMGKNWGFKNAGAKKKVTLSDVQTFLAEQSGK
ncbi:hypothetical protein A2856_00515 [Candidatus Uhrbacteria bacterium RIFCSPHIGHO2_01_FULL_63_20]|uniref:DDH domain-containing protein n=1 Tax=Candidatus Uhrbacteria bacterium RIFCSPHIGHO2_01_FULL_63_20 TaxID=1802385 RepID=A0A1F7TLV9_9BACT|nr:MAG: hypothetical protein A2856_00515 [Candidatus Uhrbacteria bacterium RIFCSPHIGHO2_01_FULL_63_20]